MSEIEKQLATEYVVDWEHNDTCEMYSSWGILMRVRASLQARLEGRNEGGDTEVMRLVDEIAQKAYDLGRKHQRHLDDC